MTEEQRFFFCRRFFLSVLAVLFALLVFFIYEEKKKQDKYASTFIKVFDQSSEKEEVVIDQVYLKKPGFLVLHHIDENEAGIGKIVGYSEYLDSKLYKNLKIDLNLGEYKGSMHKHILFAMVYYDDGDKKPELTSNDSYLNTNEPILIRKFTFTLLK